MRKSEAWRRVFDSRDFHKDVLPIISPVMSVHSELVHCFGILFRFRFSLKVPQKNQKLCHHSESESDSHRNTDLQNEGGGDEPERVLLHPRVADDGHLLERLRVLVCTRLGEKKMILFSRKG